MSETGFVYETPRLLFEPIRAEHGALLFGALGDPLVSQHLSCPPPASADELSEQFARMAAGPPPHRRDEQWLDFAVRLKADGAWIGRVEATVHSEWFEIAYLFGPSYWGKGYASESLAWLHNYLTCEHGLYEFWATVAPSNETSIRLLLRSGYQRAEMRDDRPLGSYDPGDDVFWFASISQPAT